MASLNINLNEYSTDIRKQYVYKDPSLSNKTIKSESINYDSVMNSIKNLLTFKKGERILLPEYGNSLYTYLYEPMNRLTKSRILHEIKIMFSTWEKRVSINNIELIEDIDNLLYSIKIDFNIPAIDAYNLKEEIEIIK